MRFVRVLVIPVVFVMMLCFALWVEGLASGGATPAHAAETVTKYDTEFTYLGGNEWTVTPLGEQQALHNIGAHQEWLCNSNNVGSGISSCVVGKAYKTTGEANSNGFESCVYVQGDSPAWDTVPGDVDKRVCANKDETPSESATPTPSESATPSVTPEPVYEYWDKTTVDCKGGVKNLVIVDHYRRVKGESKWTWISKEKILATVEQCPASSETLTTIPSSYPSTSPAPSESTNSATPSESETSNEPSPTSESSSSTPVVPGASDSTGGASPTEVVTSAPSSASGTAASVASDKRSNLRLAHTGIAVTGLVAAGIMILLGLVLISCRSARK